MPKDIIDRIRSVGQYQQSIKGVKILKQDYFSTISVTAPPWLIYNRLMIGLIIPPGEIKKLLEKTAQHVALNGSEFEKILIEREQHKPEFAFLKPDSPYRAYYDYKVAEISKKMIQGLAEEPREEAKTDALPAVKLEEGQGQQQGSFLEKIFEQLRQPDPEKYVAQLPEKLGEGEQAIIQHTAQYSARNGRNFLLALSEREKNNPQFQFLRPSSKSHPYFTRLVQAYSSILEMQADQVGRLERCVGDRQAIFGACRLVYDYHLARQQQVRGKKEQAAKQVRENNIDWNDFELVDTISFEPEARTIPGGELITRIQQHALQAKPMEEKVIGQAKRRDVVQHCHACRQVILASEMNKHLKTCLSQKRKPQTAASTHAGEEVDIRANLESLSLKRPDIFGAQEHKITLREEEAAAQENRVIFDGQAPNLTRTTGSIAMLHYQQKKLKEEQERGGK